MSATTEVEPYKGSPEEVQPVIVHNSSPSGSRTRIMENKVEPENCKLIFFSSVITAAILFFTALFDLSQHVSHAG